VQSKNQKFKHWYSNEADLANYKDFFISNETNLIEARFGQSTGNATLRIKLPGGEDAPGSMTISIKDPWLINEGDPAFYTAPYGYHNLGLNAPFVSVSSSTDLAYASKFQGIFLRQGYDVNTQTWTAPYYSVKADQTQSTSEHGESVTWHFQNWSGTDVTFQNASATETPLVFNASGAAAEAVYKGHLVSNKTTATGPNYSRVLARSLEKYDGYLYGSGKKYICFMAYADGS